ncbi:MAG: hypothetical protein JWQ27_68 [Ferruginibacter sp.]|nr:hypothetical protein [Ferruginibacter sp.]
MKTLLFIAIILTTFTNQEGAKNSAEFRCQLMADKEVYKIGELPRLTVMIYNDSDSAVYLIGSLDGSDVKWRYPYCYFTIDKPRATKSNIQRCGNMNTIRSADFKQVKPGQSFNPYEGIDNYGFFPDYNTTNKETFTSAGNYKIQFHYSTNSLDITKFIGDPLTSRNSSDSLKIHSLFHKVPKLELVSNEIAIKVEK